ncbi:hypothetical protein FQR65_LT17728 [Abscondita terminalis]|nr:hypothetical protein FQR65_LT17728 [Abscondita terminalis]
MNASAPGTPGTGKRILRHALEPKTIRALLPNRSSAADGKRLTGAEVLLALVHPRHAGWCQPRELSIRFWRNWAWCGTFGGWVIAKPVASQDLAAGQGRSQAFTSSSGLSTFEESGSEYVPSKSQTDFSDSCETILFIQSDSDRISSGSKKSDILPIQESLLFCSETIEHWHNNNLCLQTQTQSLEARPNVQEIDQLLNYDNVGNSLSIVQTLSSTNEAEMESFQNTVTTQPKCVAASISNDPTKIKHLSASQTLVAASISANNTLHKLRVKEEVFNIMRADEIAFVAKSDALICHFGEQYLKKHSRQQMATVCSNKMRELARLLIEFRIVKNDKSIRLCDLLDPTLFDLVIECAKKIGGYDATTKTYRAPSLSSHIGTSLKQISDLLIRLLLKKDISINILETEAKIKQVKQFRELVNTQWTTEISSLAFKNLNETKSNKPIILPLTKDIMKFKTYVTDVANKAIAILNNNNNDSKEYRNLVDATLTLTILYNRRRIGDVQYTKLETYLKNFSTINQDECLNTLTDAEKLLTKHYKRIVTGGKGSRAIVILFPQNLQNFETNPYLFAFPKSQTMGKGWFADNENFAQEGADLQDP